MLDQRTLRPGTRVRVVDHPVQVTLQTPTGVIARPDAYDDYYIVRLDECAIFHNADGSEELIPEIAEHIDNLDIIEQPS